MENVDITLRLDLSGDRKLQLLDKTRSQLQARRIEDSIFDKFKLIRDGLPHVLCPDHATKGRSLTFVGSRPVKLNSGEEKETAVDYTIHDCCCEKIADAALEKFDSFKLKKHLIKKAKR